MISNKFIISIDLGGTNTRLAILNNQYQIIDKLILNTKDKKNPKDLIEELILSIKGLLSKHKINKNKILGLGIGVPGPVDIKKGLIHFLPNIPGCKNVRLREVLMQRLKFPVFLENDANLFALGEFHLGSAKGFKNIIGITLGTGVGGGIILDGNLYRGSQFAAGEIGHMPVVMQGRSCNCGSRGCLEAYVGNKRILSLARESFPDSISLDKISILATKGNKKAIVIWQKVGYFVGFSLSAVVNLLNLDAIIIGGGVANAGRVLFKSIRETIKLYSMPMQGAHVRVIKSKLGDNAAIFGAAILVKGLIPKGRCPK